MTLDVEGALRRARIDALRMALEAINARADGTVGAFADGCSECAEIIEGLIEKGPE